MSTFINQPSLPGGGISNSTSGLSLSASQAVTKTTLNPGTVATVLAISSQQITLGNGNARVTLNAPTLPQTLQQGKEISFKLNTEKSTTLLEVSTKYNQQKLALNQQQSQQILQSVLQHPANVANRLEVTGQVVSVQKNLIQVSVGGQTLNLNVRNPQQYQTGQTLKLELSSGPLGWELDIRQDKKQENIRLPVSEAQKILVSSSPRAPIALSQNGTRQIQPILQQASDSVFPNNPVKVSLQNVEGKFVANVQLGAKPITSIPLDTANVEKLQAADLKSGNPVKSGNVPGLLINQEIQRSLSGNRASTPISNTPEKTMVYQNPVITSKSGAEAASPDLEKTIRTSQNQFTELKVSSSDQTVITKTSSLPVESIKEIKLTQVKANREEVHETKAESPQPQQRSDNNKTLSAAAQSIMATVNSLSKIDSQEIKSQVLEKLTTLIQNTQTTAIDGSGAKTAEAVLRSISQLSNQITSGHKDPGNKETLNMLKTALTEIQVSEDVAVDIKKFVKDNSIAIRPEISGPAIQTPDASKIRHLLQSPTLPVTPVSIITPPSTGGMVNGLINLLQVALTARMNKVNQQSHEQLNQVLSNIVGTQSKAGAGKNSGASLKDLSQIEQKHNLVKVLGDLLNQHAGQKIQNAERQLQGQESFYYVLPFGTPGRQNATELLITREKPEQEKREAGKIQSSIWSLTIKLPVGELGEVLTKSRVTEEEINVDFYASNEDLKNLIFNYSPLLKKRFDELGLNLQIGRVERGNIPDQLAKNPYQILETRV